MRKNDVASIKDIVAGRTCIVTLPGASINELEKRIEEFRKYD